MRPAPPLIPIAELSVDVLQAILEAGASSSTTQIVSAVRLTCYGDSHTIHRLTTLLNSIFNLRIRIGKRRRGTFLAFQSGV